MLAQCWALLILKWTLTRRTLSKHHFLSYAFLLVVGIAGATASFISSGLLYRLAYFIGESDSPLLILMLLDSIILFYCFFYAWGLLMELQRPDLIDFRKTLQLPVALPAIYLMNFSISLFGPLLLFCIPCILGLFLGLRPFLGNIVFTAGIPLAFSFAVMLGAWSYYLRGHLAILMENPRRRRLIYMFMPICFIMLGHMPAIAVRLVTKGATGNNILVQVETFEPYLLLVSQTVPIFWPAFGLWSISTSSLFLPYFLSLIGVWLFTLLGLRLGYVTTLKHYMGGYGNGNYRIKIRAVTPEYVPLTGRTLPFLGEETNALTLSFCAAFYRHPHLRMMCIMPMGFGLFVLFMHRSGAYGGTLGESSWIPMACLLWPYFNFSFFMFNIFGIDASSFQLLQLLPTPRYKYLFAKNLALAPIVLGLVMFFITVSALLVPPSGRTILLAIILSLHLYLLFCIFGNILSVKFPHRLQRDALRMPAKRFYMVVTSLVTSMLSFVLILPSVLCMILDRYSGTIVNQRHETFLALGSGFVLFVLTALIYWRSIYYVGDLLTSAETRIHAQFSGEKE